VELLFALAYLSIYHPQLVAQAATDAGPWLTALNLGLAGIGLWAFTTGRIHSDKEMQRCVENNHQLAEELRERNREARDSLVPTLVRATEILARYLDRTPNPPSKGSG
jgi:hypothetical protein